MDKEKIDMKRIFAFILALLALFSLAACGADSADDAAQPAESAEPPYAISGEWAREVTVHTVDELLSAIASDTKIVLTEGLYDLSSAADYGTLYEGAGYTWSEVFYDAYAGEAPAYELIISGVKNLAIMAQDDENVCIAAVPRYANVLSFYDCEDIALYGITAGHTELPGECTGGVIMLDSVQGAQIAACSLYGCGTIGIQASNSRGISAEGTHIFDCSISAASFAGCSDVMFNHCKVYDCGISGYGAVFSTSSSTGLMILNSDITDCTGSCLIYSDCSRRLYMLGCSIGGSTAFEQALFSVSGESIIVDNCAFDEGLYYPRLYSEYSDSSALTLAGEELNASLIAHMTCVETQHPGLSSAPAPELDVTVEEGISYVHAATVDELLAAIAPDTVIYLDAEYYDLSAAADFGGFGGDWYGWVNEYDGPGLCITGVDNLSIISEAGAEIVAVPRYVDVLGFRECRDICLSGITLGHTPQAEGCVGNVLSLSGCTGVTVTGCRMYGCGVVGLFAEDCESLSVDGCEIYDCTMYAISMFNTRDAAFANCDIHDCGQPEISLTDCGSILYNGVAISTGDYYVTAAGLESAWYDSGADIDTGFKALKIYYGGMELQDECTLRIDGSTLSLTAAYDDGTAAENITWHVSVEDQAYLSAEAMPDGSCSIRALVPKPEGVQLIAADGDIMSAATPSRAVRIYVIE